ncbi:hypothetical protein Ahy_B05g079708 [Arachis hypogaea]|uniref:Aminotransferase-like plant mobile domain-containing protein n=1 Tax=Arachis hypogaea TaxID=3818 RepID=A0A444ZAN4_ARAHY|nr:hypothetical protein Ahy_B05g079708 [Arachis hypogaea]
MPPPDCIDKFIVKCTWMQQTFSHLPEGAYKETVQRYAKAYIMMLLSTQFFGDKSGTRAYAVYPTRMWLSWQDLYSSSSHGSSEGFRVLVLTDLIPFTGCWPRVRLDDVQLSGCLAGSASGDIRATAHCVLEVHDGLDILCCDRVASGRSGVISGFPLRCRASTFIWDRRADHILRFDVILDPGPSHEYLDWWYQHGWRFLLPKLFLGDPRGMSF